jgi:hypothetical protein
MPRAQEDKVLKLIEAIEQKPILWDKSHADYSDKSKRSDVWDDVASSCGYDSN